MIVNQALRSLDDTEKAALRASITEHGQQVPIVRHKATSEVIDGHHRLAICAELGIEPHFEDLDCDDDRAEALRISLNRDRRHMTPAEFGALQTKLVRTHYATTPALGRGRKGKALAVAKLVGADTAEATGLPLDQVTPTAAEVIEVVTGRPPKPDASRSRGPRGTRTDQPKHLSAVVEDNENPLLLDASKQQLLDRMCTLARCTPLQLGQALVSKYSERESFGARFAASRAQPVSNSREVQPYFKKSKT